MLNLLTFFYERGGKKQRSGMERKGEGVAPVSK